MPTAARGLLCDAFGAAHVLENQSSIVSFDPGTSRPADADSGDESPEDAGFAALAEDCSATKAWIVLDVGRARVLTPGEGPAPPVRPPIGPGRAVVGRAVAPVPLHSEAPLPALDTGAARAGSPPLAGNFS